MKPLLLVAGIVMLGLLQAQGNIMNFGKMIWLVTGKNPVLNYGFYGCHCGFSGKGDPKDATDWCCVEHDCCYDRLESYGCGTKFLSYKFTVQQGVVRCDDLAGCRRRLCQCDQTAVYCFLRHQHSYQTELQYYGNWKCTGSAPRCQSAQNPHFYNVGFALT